jgi:hypothetical protein
MIIAQVTTSIDQRPDRGSRKAKRTARRRPEPTRAIADERSASRVNRGVSRVRGSRALSRSSDAWCAELSDAWCIEESDAWRDEESEAWCAEDAWRDEESDAWRDELSDALSFA